MADGTGPGSQAFADALARAKQLAAKLTAGATGGGGAPPPQMNHGFGNNIMGLKRSAEDDYDHEAKRLAPLNDPFGAQLAAMKSQSGVKLGLAIGGSGKACTEEIHIPDNLVGLIIGRGGEQISKIQAETGCKVQVSPDPNPGRDRACFLQGTKDAIERAKDMVMDIVTTKGQGGGGGGGANKTPIGIGAPTSSTSTTIEMLIPGAKVGLIIGKGGETIRQLQDKSGTKMYILQENMFEECDKPLRIVGEPDLVEHARQLVLELVTDTPSRNEFSKSKSEYGSGGGGGGEMHRPGGGGMPLGAGMETMKFPVPKVSVGLIIGKGGDMIKRIQVETGAKVQFDPINSNMGDLDEQLAIITGKPDQIRQAQIRIEELVETALHGKPEGGPPGRGGGGGGGGRQFNNSWDGGNQRDSHKRHFDGEEERFPVPGNRVGMVIGKGGETIRTINQQSGSHCEIDRSGPQDGPEKVFIIRGTRQQIEHAKELIMEKVNTLPPKGNRPGGGGDYGQGGGGQGWGQSNYGGGGGNDQSQWGSSQDPSKSGGDTSAQWAAYYAQYYGQAAQAQGAAQPDYTQQWIEYLRAQGQHDQANILEQQAKANKPAGAPTTQANTNSTPAPPGTTNGNGQVPSANASAAVDYSQQWAEHYRAIGKIADAEAIENYIKANKQNAATGATPPGPGAGAQQPGPPGAGPPNAAGSYGNYFAAAGYGAPGAAYGNASSTAPPGTEPDK